MTCGKQKCGEYNMLVCVREKDHDGKCNYAIDHENDYPHNKPKRKVRLPLAILPNKRVACCCTPATCTCKKPVDKKPRSGRVVRK